MGDEGEAFRDRLPLLLGIARHQVEDHAHALHRAPEDTDVAQALAGVVLFERELETLPERAGRDAVGVVRDVGRRERPQRGAVVLRGSSIPSGE